MTIEELKLLQESEDKVEFKEALKQFNYQNGRRSVLGYVVALANEGGGKLILGVKEDKNGPHVITGTEAWKGQEGKLEEDIYRDKHIRVQVEVIYEGSKRVLIIHIPSRPVGKTLKFEDVPLMRVGDDLLPMDDEVVFKILQEQEPDFSSTICEGLTESHIDETALSKMIASYAKKQKNTSFPTQKLSQVLSDLKLCEGGKLNYAALILLAKKDLISKKLPQAQIIWEFRITENQIHSDAREEITEPLFIAIDIVWNLIHQRNSKYPIRSGPYINDILTFNEEVIREAILNAVAHRDYTITSEVVIKQYPKKIIINNPGGFPKGVTIDNILTVSSTPRCRLLTEILEKTGLVERSGQGVDKIFSINLSEGKPEPDYSASDLFQVTLKLDGRVIDKAFHLFISSYQENNPEESLGVEHIISLYNIKNGYYLQVDPQITAQLESYSLIRKDSSHTNKYLLADEYYKYSEDQSKIGNRYIIKEIELLLNALKNDELKIGALEKNLSDFMNRNQIKYLLQKLVEDGIVAVTGVKRGTKYSLDTKYQEFKQENLMDNIIRILNAKYQTNQLKEND